MNGKFLAFALALSAWSVGAQSSSCSSEDCAEPFSTQGQWALLQAAHTVAVARPQQTSISKLQSAQAVARPIPVSKLQSAQAVGASAELDIAEEFATCINPSGAAAPLNEEGYAAVADRCCQAEMKQFIERQLFEMGYEVCDANGLTGITPYHSCEKGPQTFSKLTQDILEDSTLRCTWVALAGECQPPPEDCPTYGGVAPLADCGCSRSKAAKVDLSDATKLTVNNLAGLGPCVVCPTPAAVPNSGPEEFRISNAGTTGGAASLAQGAAGGAAGTPFDLVVTVVGSYAAKYPQYNGLYDGFAAINIAPAGLIPGFNGLTNFKFSFMVPGTNTPIEVEEFHLAIFDLDGSDDQGGKEFASSSAYTGYVTDVSPLVNASRSQTSGRTKFTASGYSNNVLDPFEPGALTNEQRKNSVMYFYKNVSSFELTFGIEGVSNGDGRYLFFAGFSPLDDRCGE